MNPQFTQDVSAHLRLFNVGGSYMARYNHFAKQKYKQIMFSSLNVGDKFRQDFFKNKRRRTDIICIKTGELEYIEERSKEKHTLYSAEIYQVSSFA